MKNGKKRLLSLLLAAVMLASLLPVTASASGTDALYDLRVNDLVCPVGLDGTPVFRWKLRSDTVGQAQTAYRVVVSASADLRDPVWDSGTVASDSSVGIAYGGAPLAPSTVYYWQATVRDKSGALIASEISHFETGLRSDTAWDDVQFLSVDESGGAHYTVEADMRCTAKGATLLYGAVDDSNAYMIQLSTGDVEGEIVYKFITYIGAAMAELSDHRKTVTAQCGSVEQFKTVPVHVKLDVTADAITVYLNGTQVDVAPTSSAIPVTGIGKVGFRTTASGSQKMYLDNVKLTDLSGGGDGTVVLNYTFDDGVNPFGAGSIQGGELYASGTGVVLDTQTSFPTGEVVTATGTPSFRKDFTVRSDLVSARLYSTALGIYDAFVNGERVGHPQEDGSTRYDELKPGFTETMKRKFYFTNDVTPLLRKGQTNTLSAYVTSGWWTGNII